MRVRNEEVPNEGNSWNAGEIQRHRPRMNASWWDAAHSGYGGSGQRYIVEAECVICDLVL